jgi:hypothetical protein
MKRFSPRLFVLGIALGAIGATAVLVGGAYASPKNPRLPGPATLDSRAPSERRTSPA